jgi:hypothetical protein
MSILSTMKSRRSTRTSSDRARREIARALRSAPTQASREELYLLQNR